MDGSWTHRSEARTRSARAQLMEELSTALAALERLLPPLAPSARPELVEPALNAVQAILRQSAAADASGRLPPMDIARSERMLELAAGHLALGQREQLAPTLALPEAQAVGNAGAPPRRRRTPASRATLPAATPVHSSPLSAGAGPPAPATLDIGPEGIATYLLPGSTVALLAPIGPAAYPSGGMIQLSHLEGADIVLLVGPSSGSVTSLPFLSLAGLRRCRVLLAPLPGVGAMTPTPQEDSASAMLPPPQGTTIYVDHGCDVLLLSLLPAELGGCHQIRMSKSTGVHFLSAFSNSRPVIEDCSAVIVGPAPAACGPPPPAVGTDDANAVADATITALPGLGHLAPLASQDAWEEAMRRAVACTSASSTLLSVNDFCWMQADRQSPNWARADAATPSSPLTEGSAFIRLLAALPPP
ncbi:hypothetical protein H696_00260 [Fonticula alba]|uniref:Uncharacterized protein n=1 Tax=Fonticula alba TaxID=691883 RepID=A0A058ZE52_FONAL|nr:hypothetical protein H696_00260 [Fonticula alba]KCV72680.1 hypothetical protein H696_00260 [Fonticula alba]|eukprot:XP_009492381.1 hypothetical protein H696_00260 [Fonticula alba]